MYIIYIYLYQCHISLPPSANRWLQINMPCSLVSPRRVWAEYSKRKDVSITWLINAIGHLLLISQGTAYMEF